VSRRRPSTRCRGGGAGAYCPHAPETSCASTDGSPVWLPDCATETGGERRTGAGRRHWSPVRPKAVANGGRSRGPVYGVVAR
jgi:hypothetical protein